MDFNSAIDILVKDLEEARAIIDDLKNIPGVPAFQVELAKSKCRSAAEIMELLRSVQTVTPLTVRAEASEAEKHEEPSPEPQKVISEPTAVKPEKPARHIQPVEEPEKPVKKRDDDVQRHAGQKNKANEDIVDMHGEQTIADRFSLEHELNFPAPAIHSTLTEAIGINDRFHFIREIFDDNPELYTDVIAKLESTKSIDEARSLIMGYARDESSREAGKQLLELVRRKLKSDG
jgi:hypothetical protein